MCKEIQSGGAGGEELRAGEVEIFGGGPGDEDSDVSNCADIANVLTVSGVAVGFRFFYFVYSWLADYRSGIMGSGGLYGVDETALNCKDGFTAMEDFLKEGLLLLELMRCCHCFRLDMHRMIILSIRRGCVSVHVVLARPLL